MEFGNVADWTQGLAAIAALGVSVIISKNSNEALIKQNKETIEHDKIKTKIEEIKKENAIIYRISVGINIILEDMKLRNLSISGKLKDNMYAEGCPIDDHIPYHGLQEILKDSLLKSDNKEIIFLIFRLQQALSQISERLMHDQTLQDTVGSIESWINHLESEKNTLQSMVKIV